MMNVSPAAPVGGKWPNVELTVMTTCSATETTLDPVTSATRIFLSLAALRSVEGDTMISMQPGGCFQARLTNVVGADTSGNAGLEVLGLVDDSTSSITRLRSEQRVQMEQYSSLFNGLYNSRGRG